MRCIFIVLSFANDQTENIAKVFRNKLIHNDLAKKFLLKKSFPKGENRDLILMGRSGSA